MKTVTLLAIIATSFFTFVSFIYILINLGIVPRIERIYKITPFIQLLGNVGLMAFFVQLYQKQIKKSNNE